MSTVKSVMKGVVNTLATYKVSPLFSSSSSSFFIMITLGLVCWVGDTLHGVPMQLKLLPSNAICCDVIAILLRGEEYDNKSIHHKSN